MKTTKLAKSYRIDDGKHFRLKDFDPADTGHWKSAEERAKEPLQKGIARMEELQDKLYAQDCWSVASHLSGHGRGRQRRDRQACHVRSEPGGLPGVLVQGAVGDLELQHATLVGRPTTEHLPERGHIGIFNRSYYEEVLIVRVHPKVLEAENFPPTLVTNNIWEERFEDIRCFERHMARNGTVIRKFFLHLSKKEQKRRFLARLDDPEKNWKFSASDIHEREYWDNYQKAYEDMIRNTATKHAPWYVIPADNKWFAHLAVSAAIVETLEELDLAYPKVDAAKRKELQATRRLLAKKR